MRAMPSVRMKSVGVAEMWNPPNLPPCPWISNPSLDSSEFLVLCELLWKPRRRWASQCTEGRDRGGPGLRTLSLLLPWRAATPEALNCPGMLLGCNPITRGGWGRSCVFCLSKQFQGTSKTRYKYSLSSSSPSPSSLSSLPLLFPFFYLLLLLPLIAPSRDQWRPLLPCETSNFAKCLCNKHSDRMSFQTLGSSQSPEGTDGYGVSIWMSYWLHRLNFI